MVKTVKSISKTKYEDRNATSKVSFEAVNVEIKLPNTLVLLLSSDEESVLVQVLSTLDKYAAKSQKNVEILHNANIVDKLIALLDYPQLCVKRFTIKLLSEMCFFDDVCENLLKNNLYVEKFMEYLKANADLVLKEFSALIIAQLTKHSEGYSQLVKYGNTDVLLTNLACSDPDILNNCLEIIKNLLSEPYGKNLFVQTKGFRFAPLINLLASEYPAIQNLSLDVLTALTAWASDNNLQEMFLNEGGIKNILETIQNYEMRDIHSKCFDVLNNVCENHLMLKALQSSGTRALLSYIDNIYDSELRVKALCTVLKLASTSIGRKVLLENEILDQIIPMVVLDSMSLCVCQGLVHLIKDSSALCKVIEKGIIDMLLTVIKQESRDWETREAAVFLLYEILCRDMHSCEQMVQSGKQEILIDILLDKMNNLPVIVAKHLANILGLLSTNETIREKIVKPQLIGALLTCFKERQEDTILLRIAACEAINTLLCLSEARQYLHQVSGMQIIWESITKLKTTLPLFQVVANFVYLAVTADNILASDLYQMGALKWLLENKALRNELPTWDLALKALFNNFLPLKFAYTGRLDLNDVTDSTFYITRVPIKRDRVMNGYFPILKDLLECTASPNKVVYFVNFEKPIKYTSDDLSNSTYITVNKASINSKQSDNNSNHRKTSASVKTNDSIPFLNLMCDSYLCEYLVRLKVKLQEVDINFDELRKSIISNSPNVVDKTIVEMMSNIIGVFVCNQMSGPTSNIPCTNHILDLHLSELKLELESCLIPIGYLRVGLYLERALLFKVLADQVGLPSCLVRGEYGRSWVEVALPELPAMPRPLYPSKLLRPNFIVDLMKNPGKLIPINTDEANDYCKNYYSSKK